MHHLSQNYHLRKYFLNTNEVPAQSLIKNKMTPSLAAVYFKSMSPKLKEIVGLEPLLKGGGNDWYVPPKDLLEGKSVLKPINKDCLSQLNYLGIDKIGIKMIQMRLERMQLEKNKMIQESDEKWKRIVEVECEQFYQDISIDAAKKNTERIKNAFHDFVTLYTTSINKIEDMLLGAAHSEIVKIQNESYQKMKQIFETLTKDQATMLYDRYADRLAKEKARLKAEFIENVEVKRTELGEKLHDLNIEKHTAVEKVRHYLECQNLACQVYVALQERAACGKEVEFSQHKHKKKVKILTDNIAQKDYEIIIEVQKEKKRQEFNEMWLKKVCHVVKKFQLFVLYCLNLLPEHADFFINMEKMMLLQLNETLYNPSAESIFVVEEEVYEGPIAKPHPFYIFCDKSNKYKTPVNQDLCPKKCTSDASQMPVIIVNKRCMYAACDNFQQFSNKIKYFIHGKRGDDADFMDNHVYEYDVPVKNTSSQQLLELKLESSLLQVLQQEVPNLKEVCVECGVCKTPYCFCSPPPVSRVSVNQQEKSINKQIINVLSDYKKIDTKSAELQHRREPKWESYLNYIEPKKCVCIKTIKKHLVEHLPAYMRKTSTFEAPELPNYERCSLTNLKSLVRKARGSIPEPMPVISEPKTRTVAIQCTDEMFDYLCDCFSDDELERLLQDKITGSKIFDASRTETNFRILGSSVCADFLTRSPRVSDAARVESLKTLIDNTPAIKELFRTTGRTFD